MLLLFLLADLPFQILLLSPVLLWFWLDAKWHLAVACGGAVLWGGFGWLIWLRIQQSNAEDQAAGAPEGDWRWARGVTPQRYAQQCQLYLHNHGWRIVGEPVPVADGVRFAVAKDRVRVLLVCTNGQAPVSREQVETAATLRRADGYEWVCVVSGGRCAPALRALAATRGVLVLGFSDIRQLDRHLAVGW